MHTSKHTSCPAAAAHGPDDQVHLQPGVPLQLPPLHSLKAPLLPEQTLTVSQLTTLTELDIYQRDDARPVACLSGHISSLSALVHLACKPWWGMAADLAPLKRLRKLSFYEPLDAVEQQLERQTQLKEIAVPHECQRLHMAQQLCAALPDCLVTTHDL